MHEILHHCVEDTVKILPFLFITYLLMEFIEHKTSDKTKIMIRRAGKMGPLFGGLLGVIPQCGFSAAAASFYSGRVITVGTLLAIFLSTSDEMLPILLSSQVPLGMIAKILAVKATVAVIAGYVIDFLFRKFNQRKIGVNIHELCMDEDCQCDEENIFVSALRHTINIAIFIFAATFLLNLVIHVIGEDNLGNIILNKPVIGQILSGIIGLIPNCAASVVITTLYMEGAMGAGAMMSGLLVGAGIGVLVLFRTNKNFKENLKITGLLYVTGVLCGIIIELVGILNHI